MSKANSNPLSAPLVKKALADYRRNLRELRRSQGWRHFNLQCPAELVALLQQTVAKWKKANPNHFYQRSKPML